MWLPNAKYKIQPNSNAKKWIEPKIQLKNKFFDARHNFWMTIYLVKKKTFKRVCVARLPILGGSLFWKEHSNNGNFSGKCLSHHSNTFDTNENYDCKINLS